MRKTIFLLILLLSLSGCSNKQTVLEEPEIDEPIIEEPKIIEQTATLIMGGDALTHESVYLDNKTEDGYDFTYPFSEIKKIVKDYDLAYYNQETVLGGSDYEISGYPVFNTPQEVGDALIDCGFNLVSLASNHLLDYYGKYGNKLAISQRNYFLNHKNVLAAGSYKSNEDRDNVVIKEVNGITYTLLSYTYGSNVGSPTQEDDCLINFINKELIEEDVKKYRDKVDLLMVAMHWGEENTVEETEYQREYAKFLADLDVDIVIGTHPHVLQPIEWIDDTLVIYSLGNLYSNQYFDNDNLSSCLTSVDIIKTIDGDNSNVEIKNVKCDLIYTVLNDKHKVYLYRDLTDDQLTNKQDYIDRYTNILTKYDKSIIVK